MRALNLPVIKSYRQTCQRISALRFGSRKLGTVINFEGIEIIMLNCGWFKFAIGIALGERGR